MKLFVEKILAPYFDRQRERLGLPSASMALWTIDVFSVHRSEEFRTYMKSTHRNIILDFVPGGCTSVGQPCDVGIQRPFKHSIRRSYHDGVVYEMMTKLVKKEPLILDTRVGPLRDKSVQWLWNGYNAINKPELVKKAFANCIVPGRDLDLSYETLTSFKVRERLRNLKNEDPVFYEELRGTRTVQIPDPSVVLAEDILVVEEDDAAICDDSSISTEVLQAALISPSAAEGLKVKKDGSYHTAALAEVDGEEPVEEVEEPGQG
ncbi:hypothetical protein D9611_001844 [Ephemerocybe angulata]|nr:hypothetical protein D9611_001844 [Tulosesus angulatus]